jgi:Tol biopolymer transport system component
MMVVEKHDLRTSTGDLWLIDLASGSTSQLTFDGMHNTRAVWSPDGKRIVFTGRPDGIRNLHLKLIGTESDEPLLPPGPDRLPTDWSPDGTRILYEVGLAPPRDVLVMELPQRRSVPFLDSPFDERGARFSPDGRWVAYLSNETGRAEVYVRSFPKAENKRQLSVTGGHAPRWSDDGRTLFYADPNGAVMAIDVVTTTDAFEAGPPKVLFAADMRRSETSGEITADAWFAVHGQRFFVVPRPPGPLPPAPPITVTTNWAAQAR